MAIAQKNIAGIGLVTFQKRRGSRSIRIHIHGNTVKVTLPHYITYRHAESFVVERRAWINKHKKETTILTAGHNVGKKHQIEIKNGNKLRTKITATRLILTLGPADSVESPVVQKRLQAAVERVLKQESLELLQNRVYDLSLEHNIQFNSVKFKKLKTRWGSCDSKNNLVFNIYLVQLPWELIDYVIIHELAHTKHHDHSKKFWAKVKECQPDYKDKQAKLKTFQSYVMVS